MKSILFAALLVFVGLVGWRIGGSLSSDAMGMAIGMLFGIMAGIPTALLVLASERRGYEMRREHESERERQPRYTRIEQQPPAQPQTVHYHIYPGAPGAPQLPGPAPEVPARQFRTRLNEIEERHR